MNGISTQPTDTDVTFEPITQRITEAVANAVDADPLELDPLYETIDPDALERLFNANGGAATEQSQRIVFTYAGCEVTVYGTDEVEVTKQVADEADAVIGAATPTIESN